MHDVDETPSPDPDAETPAPTEGASEASNESANDAELDQLESDLESVDAALRALDADDFDQAETLTAALTDETPAED